MMARVLLRRETDGAVVFRRRLKARRLDARRGRFAPVNLRDELGERPAWAVAMDARRVPRRGGGFRGHAEIAADVPVARGPEESGDGMAEGGAMAAHETDKQMEEANEQLWQTPGRGQAGPSQIGGASVGRRTAVRVVHSFASRRGWTKQRDIYPGRAGLSI